jgi:hypothetical protein
MVKPIPGISLSPDLQRKLEVLCVEASGPAGEHDKQRINETLMKGVRERERVLRRSREFAALRVYGLTIEKR